MDKDTTPFVTSFEVKGTFDKATVFSINIQTSREIALQGIKLFEEFVLEQTNKQIEKLKKETETVPKA